MVRRPVERGTGASYLAPNMPNGIPSSSSTSTSTSSTPRYTPSPTPPFVFGERRVFNPRLQPDIPVPARPSPAASLVSDTTSSGTPFYTPSSTQSFAFGEHRGTRSPFQPGLPLPTSSNRAASSLSDIASSSTPLYTPSSTPSLNFGEAHASSRPFTFMQNHDPDTPIPSIERDSSPQHVSRQSTPSTVVYTPSTTTRASAPAQRSEHESLNQDLRGLGLNSTTPPAAGEGHQRPSFQRDTSSTTSTPSIHITPTPSTVASGHGRSGRTDSLIHGVNSLHMNSDNHTPQFPDVDRRLRTQSPATLGFAEGNSRSPSPSRRRRSGSGAGPPTHRVEDEDPPQSLHREREVQEALTSARACVTTMADALSSTMLHQERGSNVESLYRQALRLSRFAPPSTRVVGLVGDSGVGKSSLINSLLDREDLARASNSGAACTCVVTEYHFHERDDFIVHVEYFTLDQLRRQFDELLRAYRQYKSLSRDNDITAEDREHMKKRAELALNTFKASFGARLVQTPRILLSIPFDDALNTMVDWASQILPQQRDVRESFDSVAPCASRLSSLTSENDDRAEPCLWPFIQQIRVYLNAHILKKGLVIADLPGLRDLNSARQSITERYVRRCNQVFAVAMIGRAATDQGVKEVFELARHAQLSNVGIVCTKSDDIRANEARADWNAERNRIDAMNSEIDEAKQEVEALEADIRELYSEHDDLDEEARQEFIDLDKRRRRAEANQKEAEFRLDHHIITIRNGKVSRKLREVYRNHAAGANLNVFCVSNYIYWHMRKKPVRLSLPSLQLSGILEMRRHCIGIVADSHIRATDEYIREEIPAFLGSVELWVQAGSGNASAERKQQVLEVTAAVQRQFNELTSPVSRLSDISYSMNTNFDNRLRGYMRERAAQWSVAADQASRRWHGWLPMSFSAFCNKFGDHITRAAGDHCWNEEAIATMHADLSEQWETFNDDVESYIDRTREFIQGVFEEVVRVTTAAASIDQGTRATMHTLAATLRHRRSLLLYNIENIIDNFEQKMLYVLTDGVSPVRTSIIGELMEITYETAQQEYGGGSDRRRKTIITNGFGSPTLFSDHRRLFKAKFREISNEFETSIKNAVSSQLAFIEADLDTLRDQNVVLESERNPEFRVRLAAELERVKQAMEGVRRAIDEVVNAARDATPTAG